MMCCAVAIGGCSRGDADAANPEPPAQSVADGTSVHATTVIATTVIPFTTTVPARSDDDEIEEWIEPGVIPDLGGLGYECFGQLPFTDLFVLDERPSVTEEEFASLERIVELGEADDWISFPNGVRMHREPLSDDAPQPMAVMPPDANVPTTCTPFWLTFYDQVAFQVVSQPGRGRAPIVAIEKCREPDDIEVGVRVFDGAAVLWLWSKESGEACEVDGSATMEIEVPPGVDRVLSGQRWPFGPPVLSSWYHYRQAFPDQLESAAWAPVGIECRSVWGPTNTLITWSGRTADVSMFVDSDDGQFSNRSVAFREPDISEVEATRDHALLSAWLTEVGNPADLAFPSPFGVLVGEGGGLFDESPDGRQGRTYTLTATRGDQSFVVACTPTSASE